MSSYTLHVNPSKEEIWMEHFEVFEKFYKKNKHLTLPKEYPGYTKLSQWLTYQRHHATTLTKKQIERLESIHFMDTRVVRIANEKRWLEKFNRLENLYKETGLIRVPKKDRELACWLSKQRRLMRNDLIKPSRKEMLVKLGVSPGRGRRVKKKIQSMMRNGNLRLENYESTIKYMAIAMCPENGRRTLRSVLG